MLSRGAISSNYGEKFKGLKSIEQGYTEGTFSLPCKIPTLCLVGASPKPQKQKTKAKHQKVIILKFEFCFTGILVMTEKIYRTKEIKVRLTDEEHDQLLKKMTGGQLATWIRKTCLDEKDPKRKYKAVDPELLRHLGKIGGNLNQIAYQANTLDKDIEKIKVFAELAIIREQLNELLKRYDS